MARTPQKNASVPIDSLKQALNAHSNGLLPMAAALYEAVLTTDPDNPLALGWLASIKAQQGDRALALDLVSRALVIQPANPDFLGLKANLLAESGECLDAIDLYSKALKKQPGHPAYVVGKSNSEIMLKRYSDALRTLANVSEKEGKSTPELMLNQARALEGLSRIDEAISAYERYLNFSNRENENSVIKLGELYFKSKDFQRVLGWIEPRLGALNVDSPSTWHAYLMLADAIRKLGQPDESLEILMRLEQVIGSKQTGESALQSLVALRGACYRDQGYQEQARQCYESVLLRNPAHQESLKALAMMNLSEMRLREGWTMLDRANHLQLSAIDPSMMNPSRQNWQGEPTDAPVLIRAEQGLGDEILYSRLFPAASDQASNLTITCDKRLIKLFSRTFPKIRFVDRTKSIPLTHQTLLSRGSALGGLFGNEMKRLSSLAQGSLIVDPTLAKQFKRAKSAQFRCGISWRSSGAAYSKIKSVSLKNFAPIFAHSDWELLSLQYGDYREELREFNEVSELKIKCHNNLDVRQNIEALTAFIKTCDIVITTSNSTAHLAGALGVPTLVVVPQSAGRIWYWWQTIGERSIWYPSVSVVPLDFQEPTGFATSVREAAQKLLETTPEQSSRI